MVKVVSTARRAVAVRCIGWEVEAVKAKNLMQTRAKFCEVFTLKFAFFPLSTKLFRVTVARASTFIIFHSTKR